MSIPTVVPPTNTVSNIDKDVDIKTLSFMDKMIRDMKKIFKGVKVCIIYHL